MTNRQADLIASQVLDASGVSARPPIALETLARTLGVVEIRRQRMMEEGALIQIDGRACILLRRDRSIERQRFTLAHEIAHLLLATDRGLVLRFRNGETTRDAEEDICDELAAAILMPYSWVSRTYKSSSKDLSTLRALAHKSSVSLAAALVRLDEVLDWGISLFRWQFYEGKYRLSQMVGLPPALRHQVVTTTATDTTLKRLRADDHDHWRRLPLGVAGSNKAILAQVSTRGRSVIALVDNRQLR